jgi:hypothetical protein
VIQADKIDFQIHGLWCLLELRTEAVVSRQQEIDADQGHEA